LRLACCSLLPSTTATHDMFEYPTHLLYEWFGSLSLSGDLLIVRPRGVSHLPPFVYVRICPRLARLRIYFRACGWVLPLGHGTVIHLGYLGVTYRVRQYLLVVRL
jgi:hypothetical protein